MDTIDYTKLRLRPYDEVDESWYENNNYDPVQYRIMYNMMRDYVEYGLTIKPFLTNYASLWVYIEKVPVIVKENIARYNLSYCKNITFRDIKNMAIYDYSYPFNVNAESQLKLTKDQLYSILATPAYNGDEVDRYLFCDEVEEKYKDWLEDTRQTIKLITI